MPPGCDWFVLANGPGMLAADTKAWLTTVMTEAHDAVILFRAPEPALPTEANIVAWLASGVAVFAVRVSWWRRQPVPAPSVKQTSAGWAAATVNRLTASARCYLGSIARET